MSFSSPDEFAVRREKRLLLLATGDPLPHSFNRSHTLADIRPYIRIYLKTNQPPPPSQRLAVSWLKEDMAKASFSNLQDETSAIQLYAKLDELGETTYELYRSLDVGDIIGLTGTAFYTHTGEPRSRSPA